MKTKNTNSSNNTNNNAQNKTNNGAQNKTSGKTCSGKKSSSSKNCR